jgi:alpha-tubulin suppressor-like RCC1 family protein
VTGNLQFSVVLSNPVTTVLSNYKSDITLRDVDDAFGAVGTLSTDWVIPSGVSTDWAIATDAVYSGNYSLKSQFTPNSGTAAVETTGSFREGNVSFARKVSSESNRDYLRFYIDGTKIAEWSGEQDWSIVSYPVPVGTHTFRWTYEKDSSATGGLGAAWIDAVVLPITSATTALQIASVSVKPGDAEAILQITRDGDLNGTSTVLYTTHDGTAKAGVDYASVSGNLSFAIGESSKTITVPLIAHSSILPERQLTVVLSQASGAVLLKEVSNVRLLADMQVAVGLGHSCAITSNGSVQCWGSNSSGQLGNGSTTDSITPVTVGSLGDVMSIAVGYGFKSSFRFSLPIGHTCALTSTFGVLCWGDNYYGQLGNGSTTNSSTPTIVSGLNGVAVTAISAGGGHTCALTGNGFVMCWGDNSSGQLGNGSTVGSSTPVTVSGLSGVTAIAAGQSHTCALISSGNVQCWGDNIWGQLGNGSTNASSTPVDAINIGGVKAIAAGAIHTCTLTGTGNVVCWGNGQLDIGLSGIEAISTGGYKYYFGPSLNLSSPACALTDSGSVLCWRHVPLSSPSLVSGLSDVIAIATGGDNSCAITDIGSVLCWINSLTNPPVVVIGASQTIGGIDFDPSVLQVGQISTVSATATSSLDVSFSSTTPTICSVAGNTVTGVSAGTCIIAANQAGNANYAAAPQVTQNISVTAANPTRLLNIATRGKVETVDNVMIAGFIIQGSSAQEGAHPCPWSLSGCCTLQCPGHPG